MTQRGDARPLVAWRTIAGLQAAVGCAGVRVQGRNPERGAQRPRSTSRRGERMHRIMTVPQPTFVRSRRLGRHAWRAAGAALVLAVLLCLAPTRAAAQPEAPTPGVIVSVNGNEFRK